MQLTIYIVRNATACVCSEIVKCDMGTCWVFKFGAFRIAKLENGGRFIWRKNCRFVVVFFVKKNVRIFHSYIY